MIISRGNGKVAEKAERSAPPPEPRTPAAQLPAKPAETPAPAADFRLVHHRLAALERLAALLEKGALDAAEFAAEKALILRLPAEELVLGPERAAVQPRGPSLLGRLLGWRVLAAGAALGLAVSFATQPQELLTVAERAGRLLG